jgi:hypothetical protein
MAMPRCRLGRMQQYFSPVFSWPSQGGRAGRGLGRSFPPRLHGKARPSSTAARRSSSTSTVLQFRSMDVPAAAVWIHGRKFCGFYAVMDNPSTSGSLAAGGGRQRQSHEFKRAAAGNGTLEGGRRGGGGGRRT